MNELSLFTALLLGMVGSGHCVAMCGGIAGSLSMGTTNKNRWLIIFAFQLGRTSSYATIGALVGMLGWQANELTVIPILKVISAALLVAMALYISRIWMGLQWLEKGGQRLWKIISPLSKRFLPVKKLWQAVALGSIWGWLPCGLVYTSLGYALSLASPVHSAAFMASFGLGTIPAMFAAGGAGQMLTTQLNSKPARYISALLLLIFASWTIYGLIHGNGHSMAHNAM